MRVVPPTFRKGKLKHLERGTGRGNPSDDGEDIAVTLPEAEDSPSERR